MKKPAFMADAAAGLNSAEQMHISNIALFAASAAAVFFLFLRLGVPQTAAAVLCLFIVLHPALAAAAAWLPGRNDSLLAVFASVCVINFISYIENGKAANILFYSVFLTAAMLTKETAVAIPVMAAITAADAETPELKRPFLE